MRKRKKVRSGKIKKRKKGWRGRDIEKHERMMYWKDRREKEKRQ